MLAHQAALKIQESTLIQVITNNWKPCWLNESKYLWNILMCPVHLHALNSIVVSDWRTNYWISLVDSYTNPSQSLFNHFEDVEPLFKHMVPHSLVHAWSRANFIKHASLHPKFCTEARDSVLKLSHTIGSCRASPLSLNPEIVLIFAASLESHILSDSAHFKDLIIKRSAAISPHPGHHPLSAPISPRQKRWLQTEFLVQVSWGAMMHANNLKIYLALISSAWILNFAVSVEDPFWILEWLTLAPRWRPARTS
jgi:hypothetical protein